VQGTQGAKLRTPINIYLYRKSPTLGNINPLINNTTSTLHSTIITASKLTAYGNNNSCGYNILNVCHTAVTVRFYPVASTNTTNT